VSHFFFVYLYSFHHVSSAGHSTSALWQNTLHGKVTPARPN
jgi:hypothetical protein